MTIFDKLQDKRIINRAGFTKYGNPSQRPIKRHVQVRSGFVQKKVYYFYIDGKKGELNV